LTSSTNEEEQQNLPIKTEPHKKPNQELVVE